MSLFHDTILTFRECGPSLLLVLDILDLYLPAARAAFLLATILYHCGRKLKNTDPRKTQIDKTSVDKIESTRTFGAFFWVP